MRVAYGEKRPAIVYDTDSIPSTVDEIRVVLRVAASGREHCCMRTLTGAIAHSS